MSGRSIWDTRQDEIDYEALQRNQIIETHSIPSLQIKLHTNILKGCHDCGLSKPNKVQQQVLSHFSVLSHKNILIKAPPRSGKTSSAIIGILDNFSRASSSYSLAISVCPTYETAEVAYSCCKVLGKFCDVSLYFTARGQNLNREVKSPKEIFFGTPDKILEIAKSLIKLKKASFLVIDEADCLSNSRKFFSDISQILQLLQPKCRLILSSVTRNKAIDDFVAKYMDSPVEITETDNFYRSFPIKQLYLVCDGDEEKLDCLDFMIKMEHMRGRVVIFTETKETANDLALLLQERNIMAMLLIGDLTIPQRKIVLDDFKASSFHVLITTRAFVSIIPAGCATKLIHYDQILDEKKRIDTNTYKRREFTLSVTAKCLSVCYIDKMWEEFLFQDKDIVEGKKFYNNAEIIGSEMLMEYF